MVSFNMDLYLVWDITNTAIPLNRGRRSHAVLGNSPINITLTPESIGIKIALTLRNSCFILPGLKLKLIIELFTLNTYQDTVHNRAVVLRRNAKPRPELYNAVTTKNGRDCRDTGGQTFGETNIKCIKCEYTVAQWAFGKWANFTGPRKYTLDCQHPIK
jgi:hypothetical protein